ncbi:DsbA family protein [Actinospica robiniae]|uniref:DsbA family protein n=1 Tax=Actinospica robiniae TaxID=304901 RepID=UPI00040101E6|nr:thioredoxin domain-containing protein [Actinospica robiniae]
MTKPDQRTRSDARQRAAAARAAELARARRKRQWLTGAMALVVIAAVVGIGLAAKSSNQSSNTAATFAVPKGAVADPYVDAKTHTGKATAIEYGSPDAKVTVSVFEDVRCPYCDIFELGARGVYKQYADAGEVRVLFHVVKLIDENDQGAGENASGSRAGGSALACAQNAGLFDAYHDVLYDDQPVETTDPWSDPSALITLAKKVPGLDTPTFESCVKNTTYGGFVDQNWSDFNALHIDATPTVQIDGTALTTAQLFSAASKSGVTANTAEDGQGANVAGIQSALQAAVGKAYPGGAPAPWTAASAQPSS